MDKRDLMRKPFPFNRGKRADPELPQTIIEDTVSVVGDSRKMRRFGADESTVCAAFDVTTGGFYYYFRDLRHYADELLR